MGKHVQDAQMVLLTWFSGGAGKVAVAVLLGWIGWITSTCLMSIRLDERVARRIEQADKQWAQQDVLWREQQQINQRVLALLTKLPTGTQ